MQSPSNLGRIRVEALIAGHRPGHALNRAFYLDETIFEHDLDLLLERWTWAGHVSELAQIGAWFTVELGAESAIVARGHDGELRAMANVCRHRGSRVRLEPRGVATTFTCPYHAWSYRLDGSLRAAREMPPGFDTASSGLKPLPLVVIGGLIFISFAGSPPALNDAVPALEAMCTRYGWPSAKIAVRRRYEVAANWKLAAENYHECYHCHPAHPEFAVLHDLARPGERGLDHPDDFEAWSADPDGAEVARVMRSTLVGASLTGSRDGALIAPVMNTAPEAAGACVFAEVGFLSAFLAYQDHGLIYRFNPRAKMKTELDVLWLVAGEAREGIDYDVEQLTWLWDLTSLADKRIIEGNQAGVSSRAYEPGPFSLMEPGTQAYVDRYLGELRLKVERPHAH